MSVAGQDRNAGGDSNSADPPALNGSFRVRVRLGRPPATVVGDDHDEVKSLAKLSDCRIIRIMIMRYGYSNK